MYEADSLAFEGEYTISGDGKFIILNDGSLPSDYINLFKLTNEQLVIGKYDEFAEGQDNEYVEYYYKLDLSRVLEK